MDVRNDSMFILVLQPTPLYKQLHSTLQTHPLPSSQNNLIDSNYTQIVYNSEFTSNLCFSCSNHKISKPISTQSNCTSHHPLTYTFKNATGPFTLSLLLTITMYPKSQLYHFETLRIVPETEQSSLTSNPLQHKPKDHTLIFYKYVSEKILMGLLQQYQIILFYFLHDHTLMNTFQIDQLPSSLASVGTIDQVFRILSAVDTQLFQIQQNHLKVLVEYKDWKKCFDFQLQKFPKTKGHLKAEVCGTEIIKQEMDAHYMEMKKDLMQYQSFPGEMVSESSSSWSESDDEMGQGEEAKNGGKSKTEDRLAQLFQSFSIEQIRISSEEQVEYHIISE